MTGSHGQYDCRVMTSHFQLGSSVLVLVNVPLTLAHVRFAGVCTGFGTVSLASRLDQGWPTHAQLYTPGSTLPVDVRTVWDYRPDIAPESHRLT